MVQAVQKARHDNINTFSRKSSVDRDRDRDLLSELQVPETVGANYALLGAATISEPDDLERLDDLLLRFVLRFLLLFFLLLFFRLSGLEEGESLHLQSSFW